MSFFSKIKQFLGIGTLSVKVQMPAQFRATDSALEGTIQITAKSDQTVLKIELKLEEQYEVGRDDNKTSSSFTLGSHTMPEGFDMKTGEVKNIPFSLPFQILKSQNDRMADKGGLLGAAGKLGKWTDNEKSTYTFSAMVDVKGVTLDPRDDIKLKMVK